MVVRHCLIWFAVLFACIAVSCGQSDGREVLVKEVVLDSAVVDIVYLGKNHECVLITTKSQRLYRSEDSGQSWNEITDTVDSGGVQVDRVIVNPTDKTIAVLQTTRMSTADKKRYPYIYVSENSGKDWRRAWGKKHSLHSWLSHPTQKDWALVSWWSGDCDGLPGKLAKEKDNREPCAHKLMLTTDLGKTFIQIASYVVQFSWGSTSVEQANRVYFTAFRTKQGDQGRLSLWTKEVDFNYIDVSTRGKPVKVQESLTHGNKFLISNEYILVAKVQDEARQTVHLMASNNGAKSFKAAMLPSGLGELEERWYTVLDTSEGAVILHLNSDAGSTKDTGRIFVSDVEGSKYSQSLVNNVRSAHGDCEFDKVLSLQGVYLANVVVPDQALTTFGEDAEKAAEAVEEEAAEGSDTEQKHRGKRAKPSKEERRVRSVISFDKGGAWNYMKPPRVDSVGKEYECGSQPLEDCALHLHGTTSWDVYAPFYSSESAIGIIMGTGNVGKSLRSEPDVTNTFLTRDGGLSWIEAHAGAYIYEYGDHGGLIVMADDLKKTTQVVFTWNEGESWYDFVVSSTPFEVDNIITEPNVTATTFIMFGTREEGEGVAYFLKFDALKFAKCQGAWAADSVSSDYETWMPSDGVNTEKCILGQQMSYTRRKRTSQCWNGEQFERPVVKKSCSCTQEDYACDLGFSRALGSTECVFSQDLMPTRLVPEDCGRSYFASAYRLVPGDQCSGGWMTQHVEVACPWRNPIPAGTHWWLLVALVLAGLGFAAKTKMAKGQSDNPFQFGIDTTDRKALAATMMDFLSGPLRWFSSTSRGFDGATYKKVGGNEFELGGAENEESLNDFIDEAEYDDHAPPVYDSAAEEKKFFANREQEEKGGMLSGGLSAARSAVPSLAPPSLSGPIPAAAPVGRQSNDFDMADDDFL